MGHSDYFFSNSLQKQEQTHCEKHGCYLLALINTIYIFFDYFVGNGCATLTQHTYMSIC